MAFNLVVTEPFNGFEKGATISDQPTVEAILGSAWESNVVKVNAPDAPTTEVDLHVEQ